MGSWMDQQLKVGEVNQAKSSSDHENLTENPSYLIDDAHNAADYELLHPEGNSEFSNTAALEQRRAYKLEIQVCDFSIWIIPD